MGLMLAVTFVTLAILILSERIKNVNRIIKNFYQSCYVKADLTARGRFASPEQAHKRRQTAEDLSKQSFLFSY